MRRKKLGGLIHVALARPNRRIADLEELPGVVLSVERPVPERLRQWEQSHNAEAKHCLTPMY